MQAIICVGISGAGKSTWARAQAPLMGNVVVLELDDYREKLGDRYDQSLTLEAVRLRDQDLDFAIKGNMPVIIADTNLHEGLRNALVLKLVRADYGVRLEVFDTPYEVCIERNRRRPVPVPEYAMERMWADFQLQFPAKVSA